ncbi:MAG TPA: SulP family inorganic anion transporter, partial [Saprospiraceae bacterium]|nr:SulP family inorganic anion transporter [Saprospiraceae bacterium]
GGETGWHLALGAMFVAALVQIAFGILKFGKLTDFFPLSAIHGMLAAIGIIIIAKQLPVLLNVNPKLMTGKGPIEIITSLPLILKNADPRGALIGIVSLIIMLSWNYTKRFKIDKVPAPLMVLLIAVPAELIMDFSHTEPSYALVHIGNLIDNLHLNINFGGMAQPLLFVKYVIMFALVGTLESLLTVKAIDLVDPYHRKSNNNKDLIAVGVGNAICAVLGGLPMISEVARSSANVSNGAKTRWSNFFHGFFILVFVLLASKYIEMIPNAALAAMLIAVGYKLSHPKEFINTFRIGKEQLAIFLITIVVTLLEDLLLGIAAGMLLKIIIHLVNGAPLKSLFTAPVLISFEGDNYLVEIEKSAIFTNFIKVKSRLESIPPGFNITIDLCKTKVVDHSVLESLEHFKHDYEASGGKVIIQGLSNHKPLSNHNLAARKIKKS